MSDEIISKKCSKCKTIKPISEFYREGVDHYCKVCRKATNKCYAQSEKGKINQSKASQRYMQSEKGKIVNKLKQQRYRQIEKNKAKIKFYQQSEKGKAVRKRYQESEKGRASMKRYAQSEKGRKTRNIITKRFKIGHPNQTKAVNAINHAIEAGQLPKPDSLSCYYCQAQAKQYHHHKGYAPEHWLDVVPVCIKCHNKIPKNFYEN